MADLPTIVFYVSSETYNNDLLEATYTIKARGKAEDSTQAHKWSLAGTLYGSGLYRYTQNSVYYIMGSGYFKIFEFNSPIYSATLNTSSYTDFDWSTTVTVHFNAATGLPIPGMGGVHVVWDKSTSNGGFISNTNQHVSTVKPSGYTLGDDYGYIGLQWYYKVDYDANDVSGNYVGWNSALYNENNVLVQNDGAHWTYNPHTKFAEMPATGTAPSYETMFRCVVSGVRENGLCIGVHSIPVNNKYSIYIPGELNEVTHTDTSEPGATGFIDFNKVYGDLDAISFTENSAVENFIMNKDGSVVANQFIEY